MKNKILNKLNKLLNREWYLYKRYKIKSTYVLMNHNGNVKKEEILAVLRESDDVFEIDENNFFIVLFFTELKKSFKAVQNIEYKLNKKNSNNIFAISTFRNKIDIEDMLKKITDTINYLKKNKSFNKIEDDEILLNYQP